MLYGILYYILKSLMLLIMEVGVWSDVKVVGAGDDDDAF
jgi:hypothetical protein